MAAEYDGVDALMPAITGEPAAGPARSAATFKAGQPALAHVALPRERLRVIGDAPAAPSSAEALRRRRAGVLADARPRRRTENRRATA
ncbi:hypothetical protein [Streptomyces sp. NPDC047079]|uniref:hypothetical protein n=1 Tax=Streptomyces sp. NPDC047079 TaxID=3154607 RepID=UPI0033E56C7B